MVEEESNEEVVEEVEEETKKDIDTIHDEFKDKKAEESSEDTIVTRAEEAANRLEKANKEMENKIKKYEKLQVENTLAGRSHGGAVEKEEESPEDFANKVLSGEADLKLL